MDNDDRDGGCRGTDDKNLHKVARGTQFFLNKLYDILSTPKHASIICWAGDGDRFNILDPATFQQEVIPVYFKHSNMKSFVRQLNLHGFKKIRVGSRITSTTIDSYKHSMFRQNRPELVCQIKRKLARRSSVEGTLQKSHQDLESTDANLEIEEQDQPKSSDEVSDCLLLKLYQDCKSHRHGKVIMKGLRIFSDFTDAKVLKDSKVGQYVHDLTSNYIQNVTSFLNKMNKVGDQSPTPKDLGANSFLGKRTADPNIQELSQFKMVYTDRRDVSRRRNDDLQHADCFPQKLAPVRNVKDASLGLRH